MILNSFTSQQVWPVNYNDSPQYYKGIQVNLGTQIEQQYIRQLFVSSLGTEGLAQEIENGTFQPDQNYTNFWYAKFNNFTTGKAIDSLVYVGAGLGSLFTDTWKITNATYRRQKQKADTELDLGWYYIGSSPFKIIAPPNGRLITKSRWQDEDNGLYSILDASYDYIQYAKNIATLEYSKMKSINDVVLPRTSASIDITFDGYYFYNIKLLSRINLNNTTASNVYSNSNGFPLSVQSITLQTSNMRVSLQCDNGLSVEEMDEIDRNYPDPNSDEYVKSETRNLQDLKFDPNAWRYIS